jgi:hypothetical protein
MLFVGRSRPCALTVVDDSTFLRVVRVRRRTGPSTLASNQVMKMSRLDPRTSSGSALWYFVCDCCGTKFFSRENCIQCPRCDERLQSSEQRIPPWARRIERESALDPDSVGYKCEVLSKQVEELQQRVGTFLMDCDNPMDRPMSWCHVGTFIWDVGTQYALSSWSLGEMLTGVADYRPPIRECLTRVSQDDRRRFFRDLRRRFDTRKAIVDGLYWVSLANGPRLCLLRTVLVEDPQLTLFGTVVEISDANCIEPLFRSARTRISPATIWSRVLATTFGKALRRLSFHWKH